MKALIAILLCALALQAQTPYRDFDVSVVNPIALSPSGARLFALNSPAGRLLVYDVTRPDSPRLMIEIPVGLGPVSLAAVDDDEVWVVDGLSDAISVVSVAQGDVIKVMQTGDDPGDILFTDSPRFGLVSISGEDRVEVFDVVQRQRLVTIPLPMKEPRALAYDKLRIYRNLQNDANSFYLVGEVDPGESFTDNKTDVEISDLTLPGNKTVDLDGPEERKVDRAIGRDLVATAQLLLAVDAHREHIAGA